MAPSLVLAHLVGFACAIACYRRQVRYRVEARERVFWPIFVFLFGLPGWIGYRYSRDWPVLERCVHCGAMIPRDRIACVACSQEFPLPELRGIEVLA